MTPQPDLQIIAIHILPNISQSKCIQTEMILLLKNYAENEVGRIVPHLFLFFQKA